MSEGGDVPPGLSSSVWRSQAEQRRPGGSEARATTGVNKDPLTPAGEPVGSSIEAKRLRNARIGGNKVAIAPSRRWQSQNKGATRRHIRGSAGVPKSCSCKASKCLKLYCECFKMGRECNEHCLCLNCENHEGNREAIDNAKKIYLKRNPWAFDAKIIYDEQQLGPSRHRTGCRCKMSRCIKKYCECFQANIFCGDQCHCQGCANTEEASRQAIPSNGLENAASTGSGSRKVSGEGQQLAGSASDPPGRMVQALGLSTLSNVRVEQQDARKPGDADKHTWVGGVRSLVTKPDEGKGGVRYMCTSYEVSEHSLAKLPCGYTTVFTLKSPKKLHGGAPGASSPP